MVLRDDVSGLPTHLSMMLSQEGILINHVSVPSGSHFISDC